MRTKALLGLAAVAIAIPASAQVYSANVVGYYNVPVPGSVNAIAVSLKKDQNRADQVLPFSEGDNIQVWTGSGWRQYIMDSGSSTGWTDDASVEVPLANLPILSLGKGFFYGNNSGKSSVTIVGEVLKGTNTVVVPTGINAAGSQLPITGAANSVGTAQVSGINLPMDEGSNVQFWTGSGWQQYIYDSGSSTKWTDSSSNEVPAPQVAVGQGFFIGNNGGIMNWQQWYNF